MGTGTFPPKEKAGIAIVEGTHKYATPEIFGNIQLLREKRTSQKEAGFSAFNQYGQTLESCKKEAPLQRGASFYPWGWHIIHDSV